MKNIVLIGFMGTGKTAVGRRLAARLGRRFVDTDAAIEEVTGKTVSQIFVRDGVTRFRSEETLLARKLSVQEGLVISTGGGMVISPENVSCLKEKGVLIALTASPEVIYQRVKNKKNRPLLQKAEMRERIEGLLEERAGVYDVAEYTMDTSNANIDQTVDQILGYLKERGYL
ncbi:MAG: shikimate kinase [Eubacteriales bacterium]